MLELYHNIKRLRIESGWSQDELAAKAGYKNRSMISRIEKGEVDIPLSKIHIFAKIFGVGASELMGWDEIVLTKEETKLLGYYGNLNKAGQEQLMGYARLLNQSNDYIKNSFSGMVEKQA